MTILATQETAAYTAPRCAKEHPTETYAVPCASNRDAHLAYELWRRALLAGDQQAWQVVYHDYQRQVGGWVKAQLQIPVEPSTHQTLIDDAFVKMAGTFRRHPEKFADYPNLAALLGLLRRCTQRVVQDYVTDRRQDLPIVPLEAIEEPTAEATPTPSTLWAILEGLLHDEKEWLVVTKLLIEEAKPRHLYAEQPEIFTTIDEINTIRERVKGRLQRNQAFRHYLQTMMNP